MVIFHPQVSVDRFHLSCSFLLSVKIAKNGGEIVCYGTIATPVVWYWFTNQNLVSMLAAPKQNIIDEKKRTQSYYRYNGGTGKRCCHNERNHLEVSFQPSPVEFIEYSPALNDWWLALIVYCIASAWKWNFVICLLESKLIKTSAWSDLLCPNSSTITDEASIAHVSIEYSLFACRGTRYVFNRRLVLYCDLNRLIFIQHNNTEPNPSYKQD